MERKKTFDILISFLIAIVLWFYVINIVNPQKDAQVRYVPVNVTGVEALEERGLAVVGDLQYQVNLKVVAARNTINTITADDFTATADVASLNKGNSYITVKVAAPRGVTIEDIDAENIEVVVEDYVAETKTVRVAFLDEADNQEITIKHLEKDQVTVCGAESDVSKVSYVLFNLSAKNLSLDTSSMITLPGTACDKTGAPVGGIELMQGTLSIEATIYNVKTVQLDAPLMGEPAYGELSIENFEVPPVISVKGSTEALNGLTSIAAESIDIQGIEETTSYTVNPILPDGIYKSRSCPELKAVVTIAEDAKEKYEQNISGSGIEEATPN